MTAKRSVLLVHGLSSSRRTWWRVGPELEARGWVVDTVDLPGHGGREVGTTRSLAALAEDVAAQRPAGSTLVVGHSLGAIVALQLAVAFPAYTHGVLLEDPPGRSGPRRPRDNTDDLADEVDLAHTDPEATIASLLRGHPTWSRRDARSVLEGRLLTDPAMARLAPDSSIWDLPALLTACAAPVALIAATGRYSALSEPDRGAVLRLLPHGRVTELASSHHVHLDEPARWVQAVDAFGSSLL